MTQDQIEHLARECGDAIMDARGRESYEFDYYGLARLVAMVEAAAIANVDLTQLTTRGAVAWAGVDPQALREGG